MSKRLQIFSLGGNEVSPVDLKDPKTGKSIIPDIPLQWQRTADTCRIISDIIQKNPDDQYVITHGNGPQVGNILLRAEYARPILHPLPLDICGADTQGAMAYMIGQIASELAVRGTARKVAGIITQVVVDGDDPDFKDPSKFIGPQYSEADARERHDKNGWNVKCYGKDKDGVDIWRRVVPSPQPVDILEIDAIEAFIAAGIIPITVGGGGIPVKRVRPSGNLFECNYGVKFEGRPDAPVYTGIEAVIDKDLASALLGRMLFERARARGEKLEISLTIFTNEDGAKLNYKRPDQVDLRRLTTREARELVDRNIFPAGSMGPKMGAVVKFMEAGGRAAYITKTALFEKTLAGEAGTTIIP
ncbi:MAG: hypothetical protein A2583_07990 [Bdellovibrionales bacterium RIFOXYD1_FULL_53_11]|nr:MAG: hypothetical protein A2583_07990 [Bdellovibrionales bacterium RIFOXYD1_FULL_53_11]